MMNRLMKCLAVMFCAALVSTSFADAAKDNEAEQAALQ